MRTVFDRRFRRFFHPSRGRLALTPLRDDSRLSQPLEEMLDATPKSATTSAIYPSEFARPLRIEGITNDPNPLARTRRLCRAAPLRRGLLQVGRGDDRRPPRPHVHADRLRV